MASKQNAPESDFFAFEDVATIPRPATTSPGSVSFAPGGEALFYLGSGAGGSKSTNRNLFSHALSGSFEASQLVRPPALDTEANLSAEEKLRRERMRQMSTGVTSYKVSRKASPDGSQPPYVLIPMQGDLYVQDLGDGPGASSLRQVFDKTSTGAQGGAIDAQISPDGTRIAFVQDKEVYVVSVCRHGEAPRRAVQVTSGARGSGKMNGLADFIAQEEMDRYRGFWWSPCGTRIAFEQVDEAHIPLYHIMHQGKDNVVSEQHHYPFAGEANPRVRLAVVELGKGPLTAGEGSAAPALPTTWMDLTGGELDEKDLYLARVHWNAGPAADSPPILFAQVENRTQTQLDVLTFDLGSGASRRLLRESNPCWVNLHHIFSGWAACKEGSDAGDGRLPMSFLWGSERDGYMHLYRYDWDPAGDGAAVLGCKLTQGTVIAEAVVSVRPDRGIVLFMGTDTETMALDKHLWAASLRAAGTQSCLTAHIPGVHSSVVVDGDLTRACDSFSNVGKPPMMYLGSLPAADVLCHDGLVASSSSSTSVQLTHTKELFRAHLEERLAPFIRAPTLGHFEGPSGHRLHYALFGPDPEKFGKGPYPLIVEVYGGPHVMRVQNSWRVLTAGSVRAQHLRSKGFLVCKCDNRGSARRGTDFEFQINRRMGTVECDDQCAVVGHLTNLGLVDTSKNVGVYGWSYGGYMSAMLLCKRPDTFQVAVSGAPVTHWDGYDTHYTERYMGTPESNPDGYHEGAVMTHVKNMKNECKLMLVHGLIDENVHFRHTARLINSLIQARKEYDLLLFPEERHSPRRLQDRVYMEERISRYFHQHIL